MIVIYVGVNLQTSICFCAELFVNKIMEELEAKNSLANKKIKTKKEEIQICSVGKQYGL